MFRKAVLSFLGVKTNNKVSDSYCVACKKSRKVDLQDDDSLCKTCNKEIAIEYLRKENNG